MSWIKMRHGLAEDPAVIHVSIALDLDEYGVLGRLYKFWCWADEHTYEGNAPSVTGAWIDRYVGADGFAAAMVKAGWLDLTADGMHIPNFDRHNTETAKARALTSKRVARFRNSSGVTPTLPVALPDKSREENIQHIENGTGHKFTAGDIKEIYTLYPRHVGPGVAFQAIQKALMRIKDQHENPMGFMVEKVKQYAASPAGQRGSYTPHPSTWFNQERYNDDPAEWQKTQGAMNGNGHTPARATPSAEWKSKPYCPG